MPSDVMLALGDFRFSISTAAYDQLQRSTDYRWSSQDRIGKAPALQFGGPGADTIELPGTIYPHYAGGLGQIDGMRTEANKGKPLLMVDGLGRVCGYWVIEAVRETQGVLFADGVPRRMEFSLNLRRYNDPVRGAQ